MGPCEIKLWNLVIGNLGRLYGPCEIKLWNLVTGTLGRLYGPLWDQIVKFSHWQFRQTLRALWDQILKFSHWQFRQTLRGLSDIKLRHLTASVQQTQFLLHSAYSVGKYRQNVTKFFLPVLVWPLVPTHCRCRGLLLHLITLNDTHTHTHTHIRWDSSGRGIGPSQRPVPDNAQHTQQTDMSLAGFEPAILASKQAQTHALDRAATGVGNFPKSWY
jgi:hypothetical protein